MKTPTAEQLQDFKDANPHLKVKVTKKAVQIKARRRQAPLEPAPADIKKRSLKADAFVALRMGFENRKARERAKAAFRCGQTPATPAADQP